MFGYIIPNYDELKVRELKEYRQYYCGLCRCLKERYGVKGQITLTYDMTFLGLLLTSLYEPEITVKSCRCVAHPAKRHEYIQSDYLYYAADMNILLMYYKCLDDWKDEHKVIKAGYAGLLKRAGSKVKEKYPDKAARIQDGLDKLSMAEKEKNSVLDEEAGYFGDICSSLFVFKKDEWSEDLSRIGYFIGKFIYLLDAYEDLEDDINEGRYNPYIVMCKEDGFDEKVRQILVMMMSEVGRAFERLPILENVQILKNIIYSGVWCRYDAVCKKKKPV
ncbi:MAG: DUF5685 family protein [Lachnospiraceae bacterium]|nr:DUF5685 family protein [Lachnospiraceae bacterium]MCI5586740.1 DUF5685 family protein [Lachnospiraceae bacterium]